MKRSILSFALGLLLLMGTLGIASPAGADPLWYSELRTDGEIFVYTVGHHNDAFLCQRQSGADKPPLCLSGNGFASGYGTVDVGGDRLVWTRHGRLGGMSFDSPEPLDLPAATAPDEVDSQPALSGDRLVWLNRPGPDEAWRVLTIDLKVGGSPQVVATLPDDISEVGRPVVSGTRIAWAIYWEESSNASGTGESEWQLWTVRIGEDPMAIASDYGSYLPGYDVGDDLLVYASDGNVKLVDIGPPHQTRLLSTTGSQPTTDGRYVFWTDEGYSDDEILRQMSDIHGYDARTDSYLRPSFNPRGLNYGPWTRGGVVVWWSVAPDTSSPYVEARAIQDILPSASRPDPGKTDRAWLYFTETGHYLSYGFKDFWVRSGGLPVFGYPLTIEYDELNQDLDEFRTVQYTERQRFEYHPDLAGTPYETLLGRLGAEDAKRRGLTSQPAFQRVSDPGIAGVEYFAATGHTLRGPFREYWHSHGLDFGDSGISYRESLALFGYPISEEFVDPETGLKTQYFERAVFEYHPDNPDPYKVLLRLLGSEEMERRGW
jgi:hypothetical protein